VHIYGEEGSDLFQSQVITLRYQPEIDLKELLKQVCQRKRLKEDEWAFKFLNMDVTCSLDLSVGDLGVVALRLVKRSEEVGVSDLGDLVD
jgi:hypothetical protein